jgi:hypothetical protein
MENYQLLIKGYETDRLGIGNVLKCLVTALSINNDVKIRCAPDYLYGAYDTILEEPFVVNKEYTTHATKEVVPVSTCRFNLLYFEEELQEDLPNEEKSIDPIHPHLFHWYFSKKKRIDWYYDPLRVHPQIRSRILSAMDKIRWKRIVWDTVETWHTAFVSRVSLGISIRTWTASHEKNIARPYTAEAYYTAIATAVKEHPEIQTFVLSLDRAEHLAEYVTHLSTTYPSRSILVLSRLPSLNPIQYAVTKAFTLARCHYVIGNRISTFTELIYWFGRCQPVVYTVC